MYRKVEGGWNSRRYHVRSEASSPVAETRATTRQVRTREVRVSTFLKKESKLPARALASASSIRRTQACAHLLDERIRRGAPDASSIHMHRHSTAQELECTDRAPPHAGCGALAHTCEDRLCRWGGVGSQKPTLVDCMESSHD